MQGLWKDTRKNFIKDKMFHLRNAYSNENDTKIYNETDNLEIVGKRSELLKNIKQPKEFVDLFQVSIIRNEDYKCLNTLLAYKIEDKWFSEDGVEIKENNQQFVSFVDSQFSFRKKHSIRNPNFDKEKQFADEIISINSSLYAHRGATIIYGIPYTFLIAKSKNGRTWEKRKNNHLIRSYSKIVMNETKKEIIANTLEEELFSVEAEKVQEINNHTKNFKHYHLARA